MIYRFKMSGQAFEFDGDQAKFMGDEVLLVEDVTGEPVVAWVQRIQSFVPTGKDMLLLAFLARHRENPLLEWQHFVKTIAPFTLELVDEPVAVAQPVAPKPRTSRPRKPAASS